MWQVLWCCFSVRPLSPALAFEVIPSVLIYTCMPGRLGSGLCAKLCVEHVCAASLLCGASGYVQTFVQVMCRLMCWLRADLCAGYVPESGVQKMSEHTGCRKRERAENECLVL